MKIYTKTGDKGSTGLFSGLRVSKNSSYIEAYGTVDEFNSLMGWAAVACKDQELAKEILKIQNELHNVCADLATPIEAEASVHRVEAERAKRLEKLIDQFEKELK